ncbi:MAG TPA: hypothetical protein VFH62_08875 [Dehalococcoidia bacterium]|nr:hypothetical protein [Dehalococcoidia bacterium]
MQDRDRDIVDNSPMGRAGRGRADDTMDQAQRSGTQSRQEMSQKATEFTEKTREKADEGMQKAAGGMEDTAQKLRDRTEDKGGMQAKAGEKVAEGMEKTAGYLREKDTQQIMDDVEQYVREHPVQAIAGALFGGFVIARILR